MTITKALARAEAATNLLRRIATEHPEWIAERNSIGNLWIGTVDEEPKAYIDFFNDDPGGEV